MYSYWHDKRFINRVGGPIKVWELSDNLTSMGHTVYLFVPKLGFPELQTSAKVQVVPFIDLPVIRFLSFQVFSIFLSLLMIAREGKAHIIYVRIMWSFLPMIIGKLLRVPAILEVNDSPHRAYANIRSVFKRRIVHLIDRISYRLSSYILPVTKKIAEDLHHIDNVPLNRMAIMPSGANTDLFHPHDKIVCCRKLGFDPQKNYVGFIGTFLRYQGIDLLIKCAPFIIQKNPDVMFLLVGDGLMKSTWEEKIKRVGLEAYFIFTGQVLYKEVPIYCSVMDVCVSPFLKEAGEFSPVKVFDYLACGKPVIMSDVSFSGEIFKSSGAVHLVPPEDPISLCQSILRLLGNEDLRSEMGKKGREFVLSKYDRKKIAKTVETIAFQLIRKNA